MTTAQTPIFAVIGASGKVGYATSLALRNASVSVRAIVRHESKASPLRAMGCEIATADLHNPDTLAVAIRGAETVQVILPPSPQIQDPATDMRELIESIAVALEQVSPKRMLAISDYGAHVSHDIGMPSMLRAFEQRLTQLPGQKVFLRSAEHIQNWGRLVPVVMATGHLPSFHHPPNVLLPTISAVDLGKIAAGLLLKEVPSGDSVRVVHAEADQRYSDEDVARVLGQLLGKRVDVATVPREQWAKTLEKGVSPTLAELLVKANDAINLGGLVDVEQAGEIIYGSTKLSEALQEMLSA